MSTANKIILILAICLVVTAMVIVLGSKPKSQRDHESATLSKGGAVKKPGGAKDTASDASSTQKGANGKKAAGAAAAGAASAKVSYSGSEDPAVLRLAIFGSDTEAREKALNALAQQLAKGKGREILMEMLDSGITGLEQEVLPLLPNLAEEQRLPVIDKCLDNKSKEFRVEALNQMRDLAGPDVNNLLMKAMKDPEQAVLDETANLFFYFDDQPLYKSATEGLKSTNETIREAAFNYLQGNHTLKSVEVLIQQGLSSSYPEMVANVGDALRFITDAEIDSNNSSDWLKWLQEKGKAWAEENDSSLLSTPSPAMPNPTPATTGAAIPKITPAVPVPTTPK